MQDLGQDIKDIQEKVKVTSVYVTEHQILSQQNERLSQELNKCLTENLSLKSKLASRDTAINQLDIQLSNLQRQLLEERARNQEYNESLQELTLRVKSEADITTTQIEHLQAEIAVFQS